MFELTERDGRWHGRGAADCKGNIVMHLTALRALKQVNGGFPCGIKLISEGSEEQGTGGLEEFVPDNVELLRADTILVCDTGNFAVGVPTLTTTLRGMTSVDIKLEALASAMHSGMFGGPAPDAIAGLMAMLGLAARRARQHHDRRDREHADVAGRRLLRRAVPRRRQRARRRRPDRLRLARGHAVGAAGGDRARHRRPARDRLGRGDPGLGRRARQPADPAGMDGQASQDALIAHLEARVPWDLRCTIERVAVGDPFVGSLDGPAYESLKVALEEAYGREMTTEGQGGSIPLCNVFAETFPDAEIFLMGVEEPKCLIHAPNESVDPSEIEHLALAEALFLERYARGRAMTVAVHRRRLPRPDRARRRSRPRTPACPACSITPGPDLVYLTGYMPTAITERLTMLVAHPDREPAMLVPILERPDAEAATGAPALALSDWTDG